MNMLHRNASPSFCSAIKTKGQIWRSLVIIFLILFVATTSRPEEDITITPGKKVTMPSGQFIIISKGQGEPENIGSYSVRLYSGQSKASPLDNFVNGLIRPRNGQIVKTLLDDLDQNGEKELIVIIRSNDGKSYQTADAFAVSGQTLNFFETVTDLPLDSDPVRQLRIKVGISRDNSVINDISSCKKMQLHNQLLLPDRDKEIPLEQIRQICMEYDLPELWSKIVKDPPQNPFKSDGCSLWLGSWNGTSLYSACFLHDLKYWAGYPDEDIARLVADAELMIDIACLLNATSMAETMFHGIRLGGHEMYRQSFSWGFGRN